MSSCKGKGWQNVWESTVIKEHVIISVWFGGKKTAFIYNKNDVK